MSLLLKEHEAREHQLVQAAEKGDLATVKTLLTSGVSINARGANGATALILAAFSGQVKACRYLIEQGISVGAADDNGFTALMTACESKNASLELVDLLVTKGAKVNAKSGRNATALMAAAKLGHRTIVEYLLQHGASVDLQNNQGVNALIWAADQGHAQIVQVLLAAGANPDLKTDNGYTASSIAKENGHYEIVKILEATPGCPPSAPAQPSILPVGSRAVRSQEISNPGNLRPLGNKKRLLWKEGQPCLMYALLFADATNAKRYAELFIRRSRDNPPPMVLEVMVVYVPRSLKNEKFAFVLPYMKAHASSGYDDWAAQTLACCNETLPFESYFAGYEYTEFAANIETVMEWHILLPPGVSIDSPQAAELLCDSPDLSFASVKLQASGATLVPTKPAPQGPWVGILVRKDHLLAWTQDAAVAKKNKTAAFLEVLGERRLSGCIVHGTTHGDGLFCMAIHTDNQQDAAMIEQSVRLNSAQCLALKGARLLSESEIPEGLPYNGFLSKEGIYVGN